MDVAPRKGICVGTFEDGYRCWRLAANQLETAGRQVSLPRQPCLSLVNLPCQAAPAPAHRPAERSYYLQGFLSTIMGGRWLRGAKAYKGGWDSNFERVNNPPGEQRSPVPPEEPQ